MIDSYKKLTIAKYYEIESLAKEEMEDLDKQVALIAILADMTEDEVLDLPLDEYHDMVDKTAFLFEAPKIEKRIPTSITVGGRKYRLLKEIDEMTAGEFIDFQTYIKEKLGVEYLLSCVLIPENEKYGEGDTMEIITHIKNNLTIETALSISAFFQRALQLSIQTTQIYLELIIRKMERKEKNPEIKKKLTEARMNLRKMKDITESGDLFHGLPL